MKRYIKLLLALMLMHVLPASASDLELLIYKVGDVEGRPSYSVFLRDKPQISFEDNALSIKTSAGKVVISSLRYTDVLKMNIIPNSTGKPTDIEETLLKSESTLRITFTDGQTVIFEGDVEGTAAVYGIDGRVLPIDIEHYNDRVTFHLNSQPQGIYIIRIGNQSFKIYKKS
jgi:hypothetical protein